MRIVLADDAALLREGLAALLADAGHEVVAQAVDAPGLVDAVEGLASRGTLPDAVITDVRMPPGDADDGLRAAVTLRAAHPGLPVVVLSAYTAGDYVRDLLAEESGGVGYLLKERVGRVEDFMRSLQVVVGGGVVVDPEVVAGLLARTTTAGPSASPSMNTTHGMNGTDGSAGKDGSARPGGASAVERLTHREREVLALMAEGLSNSQIAARLVVSDGAVAKHVAHILAKLDLPPEEENRRVRAVLAWLRATA
ncbi:DNA-binding response regulator, NarL/FixJ family, contains REC and HTH domains [Actinomyces denticolens]|uniref:DNA-binding response regulator, NarL/FixJ family, contains REC and HTH domains n=1 Tax=Actinomyces denticolens TaxID=52767 RepID=A0ABY1ICE1_9ACTO|nr:response regulator transcription factor [Actinomyces denticolens]SHI96899.1 DNA-binding response regulator, NarL/FixJ family, contains REC and HTH domains [Actinomyces denticolens]